jgi:hypothetical protein
VSPYNPTIFSVTYSRILACRPGGRFGADSMRVIVVAESPEPLCMPLSRVQVVLRESPKISACSSSVSDEAAKRVAEFLNSRQSVERDRSVNWLRKNADQPK